MDRFLYVFSNSDKERLLKANYTLLKSDDQNEIYVFANRRDLTFAIDGISFISSNTLTF